MMRKNNETSVTVSFGKECQSALLESIGQQTHREIIITGSIQPGFPLEIDVETIVVKGADGSSETLTREDVIASVMSTF